MKTGARVLVIAAWSGYRGRRGRIESVNRSSVLPILVRFDDGATILFGESELLPVIDGRHIGGAE